MTMPDLTHLTLQALRAVPGCGRLQHPQGEQIHHFAADYTHCDACLTLLAQAVERETREEDANFMDAASGVAVIADMAADAIRALPSAYGAPEKEDG